MVVVQYSHEFNLTVTAGNYDTYTSTVLFESPEDQTLDITLTGRVTGVDILTEDSDEVLYDLNGLRITEKPEKGIYIIRSGNKTRKVVI